MSKFIVLDNRLLLANEHTTELALEEKQLADFFAENLRELRNHCKLSLKELSAYVDIPNQTLSSYENKTHIPSMLQAVKISAFFGLTLEEFILCGFDGFPYDIAELYEKRKNNP